MHRFRISPYPAIDNPAVAIITREQWHSAVRSHATGILAGVQEPDCVVEPVRVIAATLASYERSSEVRIERTIDKGVGERVGVQVARHHSLGKIATPAGKCTVPVLSQGKKGPHDLLRNQ